MPARRPITAAASPAAPGQHWRPVHDPTASATFASATSATSATSAAAAAEEEAADHSRHPIRDLAVITFGSALTAWLTGRTVASVADDRNAPWILGRASGIGSYLALVALVALGLVLSHPRRTRWRRPGPAVRLRIHISLAVFTLTFLILHVVVLATDEYAKVGWWGALLPMSSQYRPAAVTLGVVGAYCGLLTGLTAALAGRLARRIWWPVHKVAAASLILVWLHGVLAGSDSAALRLLYLGTALALVILALSRYTATTPADRVRDLLETGPPAGDRRKADRFGSPRFDVTRPRGGSPRVDINRRGADQFGSPRLDINRPGADQFGINRPGGDW